MIKLPDNLSRSDMRQWLRNGVMLMAPEGQEITAWRVSEVDDTTVHGYYLDDQQWISDCLTVAQVRRDGHAFWPLTGYYNIRPKTSEFGLCVVLNRVAARQYKRTYNSEPMRVGIPDEWSIGDALGNTKLAPVSECLVEQIIPGAAWYPDDVRDAVYRLDRDEYKSIALSRHVAIMGDDVHYRGEVAGHLMGHEFIPSCDQRKVNVINKVLGGYGG